MHTEFDTTSEPLFEDKNFLTTVWFIFTVLIPPIDAPKSYSINKGLNYNHDFTFAAFPNLSNELLSFPSSSSSQLSHQCPRDFSLPTGKTVAPPGYARTSRPPTRHPAQLFRFRSEMIIQIRSQVRKSDSLCTHFPASRGTLMATF